MRSRYSAYALRLISYLIATTDPEGPRWVADSERWQAELARFACSTRFEGLRISEHVAGEQEGFVTFHATLSGDDGRDSSFTERSRFVLRDGRWLYHAAS